jgi:hypothetical protein
MSGIDLNRPIGAEEIIEDMPPWEGEERFPESEEKPVFSFDFSFLRVETGSGSIEERLEHPLNVSRSRGVAQVIRGCEGLFGSLNLAVVDIVLGLIEVIKERRALSAS